MENQPPRRSKEELAKSGAIAILARRERSEVKEALAYSRGSIEKFGYSHSANGRTWIIQDIKET